MSIYLALVAVILFVCAFFAEPIPAFVITMVAGSLGYQALKFWPAPPTVAASKAKEHHGVGRSWPPYSASTDFFNRPLLSPQVAAVQTLTIKPGQVLVLSVDGFLTKEMRRELRDAWKEAYPECHVVVLDQGMRLAVVDRADIGEDAS